ncbi:hypothetical protein H8R18_05330 [Nanchangia anserum]|uniref:Uncharacterized protein n=1 Tax=Nanchangia anserum TaxID=2692125 RepID=A0A8I0GA14_9ACTO|nr:hypothetical protein [Nanchangia anserum]MBD3688963.1 hypothetical protein [Nanchangia anserum]QOX81221.1 hypothetical protein H8R18_05330 [Nanchangia anserum]
MSAASGSQPTPGQVRRRLIDQLPFRPACTRLAVRTAVAMLLAQAICGAALALGVSAGNVRQPFLEPSVATWRGLCQGFSSVMGGGLFGQGHASTGIFAWGTLATCAIGYAVALRSLRRQRLPMLRDVASTPLLCAAIVAVVNVVVALIGGAGSFGPSGSRAFFISAIFAVLATAGAFVRASADYDTFMWRHVHRFLRGTRPALIAAAWFFGAGSLVTVILVAIAIACGHLPLTISAASATSLGLAGANLIAAVPVTWLGGAVTIGGAPMDPTSVHAVSLYSSLGLGYTIAALVLALVVSAAASIALVMARQRRAKIRHILATFVIWLLIASFFQALSSLRWDGEWSLHVHQFLLTRAIVWTVIVELFARYVAPLLIAWLPPLRRRAGHLLDELAPELTHPASADDVEVEVIDVTSASTRSASERE